MRDIIPLMELIKEMKDNGISCTGTVPKIHCTLFEDNHGAIKIATIRKYRPRTKHINNMYHHFRYYYEAGNISIKSIGTECQQADMLTKALPLNLLIRHRLNFL